MADIFFAQTAAGSNNGTSCANAFAYSDGTNGINVATQQASAGVGNRLHLCGTITGTQGQTFMTFATNGSAGNPITVIFEPNALLTSPQWSGVFVNAANHSFITIDGGTNGTVENTLNGTSGATCTGGPCAFQNPSTVVSMSGGHDYEFKNLHIHNIYVHTPGGSDGNNTGGISFGPFGSGTLANTHIHHNEIHDLHSAIFMAYPAGMSNVEIDHNTTANQVWGVALLDNGAASTATNVRIHDNDISGFINWFDTGFAFHFDGIFISAFATGSTFTQCQIYNNFMHGPMDVNGTAFIFVSGEGGGMDHIYVFNNVFFSLQPTTGNTGAPEGLVVVGSKPTSVYVVNNTAVSANLFLKVRVNDSVTGGGVELFQNNIGRDAGDGQMFALWLDSSEFIHTTNNNVYFNVCKWNWLNVNYGTCAGSGLTYANYLTASGQDAASVLTDPKLSSTYTLQAGSSAINLGVNLTSLGITALNTGAPATFGITGACGTGCTPRPSTGAWDAGAYPFSPVGHVVSQVLAFKATFF